MRAFVSIALLTLAATNTVAQKDAKKVTLKEHYPKFRTEYVQGKVVYLGEALKQYYGISTEPETHQRTLAIYTRDGQLLPLAENLRGRAFRTDQRLRNKPMELFVRRYEKHPILQVIRTYELRDEKKYQVDYWCDVCAIVMFEQGDCACCQDNNRLRHRLVDQKTGITLDR